MPATATTLGMFASSIDRIKLVRSAINHVGEQTNITVERAKEANITVESAEVMNITIENAQEVKIAVEKMNVNLGFGFCALVLVLERVLPFFLGMAREHGIR
jgi:hypothetical protein